MRWLSLLFFVSAWMASAMADCTGVAPAADSTPAGHELEILQWRQEREESLRSAESWLTLVGLEWLKQGTNRVGAGPDNDLRLTVGPDYWGTIEMDGDSLVFIRSAESDVTVDGGTPERVALVADKAGKPTVVRSGASGFSVIYRESYALRVFNNEAPALLNFKGVPTFDIQPAWRIEGRLVPAKPGQTIEIGNVLGQVSATPVYGVFEFEREGKHHKLIGLGEEASEDIGFIFSDRTNGKDTYGAGRFLSSEGLPVDGRLVVDFNKAYNPPCAFSDYATCPLPPQENRLDLAVTAGEKDAHLPGVKD